MLYTFRNFCLYCCLCLTNIMVVAVSCSYVAWIWCLVSVHYLLQLLHYFIAHVTAHMCIYTALLFAVECMLLHTHMLRCYLMLGHCYHCRARCCFIFFCLLCYPCNFLTSLAALLLSNTTLCQYNLFMYYLRLQE